MQRPPDQNSTPLRIGVMLDAMTAPRWIARALQEILVAPCLEISLLVVVPADRRSLGRHTPAGLSTILFRLYEQIDRRLFKAGGDALESCDLREELASIPTLCMDREEEGAARIQAANLDVIVDFRCEPGTGEVRPCARYGIWSLHHADSRQYHARPVRFWEMYDERAVSAEELCVCDGIGGNRRVLYRSFSRTDPLSLYRSRTGSYGKSIELLMLGLRDLHRRRLESISTRESGPEWCEEARHPTGIPGNGTMLRFLARLLRQLAGRGLQPLFFQNQWLLALRVREAADAPETNSCRLIVPPRGVCYADPFVFQKDGRHYLFFEEYRHDRPKGVISCLEVDALGNCSQPTVVLERDYHLSYPSVFAWQGEVYMMPETSYRETVELYRAVEFPYRWDLERVLFENVRLLDPTLCEHAGKFWLFAGIKGELRSINNALNLFFADSPLGPWKAHPKNPIVLDVRRARPAGRLFRVNGQLFRPAQDSSVRYGYAVTFHRVETLSETEYYEVPVGRIDPGWLPGNLATHTFNASVDFEVVDAQWRCSRYRLPYLSHPTASAPASIGGPASLWFQPPAT